MFRDPFKEFEDFFRSGGRFPMQGAAADGALFPPNFGHVDVIETEAAHIVKVDLPGMKKCDVRITLDSENVLTISGERQRVEDKKDASYSMSERHYGKFSRAFRLSEDAEKEGIVAEMKDGVLSISIPRANAHGENMGPRDIPIADSAEVPAAAQLKGSEPGAGAGSTGAHGASGSTGDRGKEGVESVSGGIGRPRDLSVSAKSPAAVKEPPTKE